MVNQTQASAVEKKVLKILRDYDKLKKYDFDLHIVNGYGIDIEPKVEKYKGLAIEIENTETHWPDDAPYPPSWRKGFTVPSRKQKFYVEHPMSLYVKVNSTVTRAVVAPMAFICGHKPVYNSNREERNFRDNNFYMIKDPDHPAICYCSIDDLPKVVASQLDNLYRMGNTNKKFTGSRPIFDRK